MARLRLLVVVSAAFLTFPCAAAGAAQPDGPTVLSTRVEGVITPVVAAQIAEAVEAADAGDHRALLVELDTPGGLDSAMRSIVQDVLSSDVPALV